MKRPVSSRTAGLRSDLTRSDSSCEREEDLLGVAPHCFPGVVPVPAAHEVFVGAGPPMPHMRAHREVGGFGGIGLWLRRCVPLGRCASRGRVPRSGAPSHLGSLGSARGPHEQSRGRTWRPGAGAVRRRGPAGPHVGRRRRGTPLLRVAALPPRRGWPAAHSASGMRSNGARAPKACDCSFSPTGEPSSMSLRSSSPSSRAKSPSR